MNVTYFLFFLFILFGTLIITYWAAQKEKTTRQFYAMSGSLSGIQNGLAIAGDFMSAASFLGITGSIALKGFDGLIYALGFTASFLVLLFLVAEPVRHIGQYTVADVIYTRFPCNNIRLLVSLSTILISILYMIPQLVAAGLVIQLLLHVHYHISVVIIGVLMVLYVVFGGMMAASWVQIVKTILRLSGVFLIVLIILSRFRWDFFSLVDQVSEKSPLAAHFFLPGQLFRHPLEALSLNFTLLLGTAGLPHILVRFYTVKNQLLVRQSVISASWFIGLFYFMILILGFGTVAVVGVEHLKAIDPSGNLAAPLLAHALGGDFLTAFISAIAFATILAVVTGLVVTSTTSFAYDIYNHIFKKGDAKETEQLRVAKIAAIVIGVIAIALSLNLKQLNVTFLVSLTFSVAASIILPVLVLTLYWKRFNRYGVFCGMGAGMITSIVAVIFGPMLMSQPLFPLKNPGIVTIPIGFLGAIFGTFCFEKHEEDIPFQEFEILSQTGISVKKMVR